MVYPFAVIGPRLHIVVSVVLLASLAGVTRVHTQASTSVAPLLDQLIERGAEFATGTYTVTDGGVVADTITRSLVVQADVRRGPAPTIRAAIVLGAEIPQPYEARIRVLAAPVASGPSPAAGDARGVGQAGQTRFIRELTLSPGEYQIHAAIASPRTGGGATVTFSKIPLVVPDVWRGTLAVTPVVLGDEVTTMRENAPAPFAFEPTLLTPTVNGRIAQSGRLHVAFRVYNWAPDQSAKPDLGVEYVFYELTPRGARFFNKMKPQHLNAGVLGAALDVSDGAVTAGASLPLLSFPFGEFELTVRVTDNRSRQRAERKVRFAVVP